jgi:hypothetical protein
VKAATSSWTASTIPCAGRSPTSAISFASRALPNGYWDFAVLKAFKLSERSRLDFRADFFNIFNHPVFALPATAAIATQSTFGQITITTIPARLIQFGLHFRI